MTKKDYISAASIIRTRMWETEVDRLQAIDCFVILFQNNNPSFNEKLFREACVPIHGHPRPCLESKPS